MKTLYLIRGVSGSGKSTLALELAKHLPRAGEVSADEFFITSSGEYEFDVNDLGKAHSWCKAVVSDLLSSNTVENVIVHNTFTTEKELKPYLELAELHSAKVVSLVVENRHGNHSVHDVPEETVAKQASRLQASIKLV